jgi:FkbM family methyltransferase
MRKMIKYLWRLIPSGTFKTKIQCILHSRQGFSFTYRQAIFEVRGPHGLFMLTNEAPFNIVTYYRWFLKYYTPIQGDVLVDAGAYNGHVSILLSKLVGSIGQIIAFEPDPSNRLLCEKNVELNNCTNITLIDKGLWVNDAVLEFNSNNSVASSVFYQAEDACKIQISVTSLDLIFQRLGLTACHYIKMNIEGSEIMALMGASQTLEKYKPSITVTTDHVVDDEQTTQRVENILKAKNYKTWTETEGGAKITYAK